jgi:hypothetical protein
VWLGQTGVGSIDDRSAVVVTSGIRLHDRKV